MRNTEVTTGIVRLSFVHLKEPYSFMPENPAKYSATILLPKEDTATKAAIDAAIEAAKQYGVSAKWNGKMPPVVNVPIYDGDGVRPNGESFGPECSGCWVFTASANEDHRPQIVDLKLQPIVDPMEIYSGMYARVNVNFFAYAYSGKRGIGCGLGPVQKVKDGEPLGGGFTSAADAFGGVNAIKTEIDPITGEINVSF